MPDAWEVPANDVGEARGHRGMPQLGMGLTPDTSLMAKSPAPSTRTHNWLIACDHLAAD